MFAPVLFWCHCCFEFFFSTALMASGLRRLEVNRTLFLLCDVQEKFRSKIFLFDGMIENTKKLVEAGKIFKIPLIATEQYPEKLGKTIKELNINHAAAVEAKTRFSMFVPKVQAKIKDLFSAENGLRDVVLFGLETHVCIEQTAIDLIENKYNVFLAADCCSSRLVQDRNLAIRRLQQHGCVIATSESILFNILQAKEHPNFSEIQKLVSAPSVDMGL